MYVFSLLIDAALVIYCPSFREFPKSPVWIRFLLYNLSSSLEPGSRSRTYIQEQPAENHELPYVIAFQVPRVWRWKRMMVIVSKNQGKS